MGPRAERRHFHSSPRRMCGNTRPGLLVVRRVRGERRARYMAKRPLTHPLPQRGRGIAGEGEAEGRAAPYPARIGERDPHTTPRRPLARGEGRGWGYNPGLWPRFVRPSVARQSRRSSLMSGRSRDQREPHSPISSRRHTPIPGSRRWPRSSAASFVSYRSRFARTPQSSRCSSPTRRESASTPAR